MDLQRLFLFLIFVFSTMLVWDGWQRYQHPELYARQDAAAADSAQQKSAANNASSLPSTPSGNLGAILSTQSNPQGVTQTDAARVNAKTISVQTDVITAEISTLGGDITRVAFSDHPDGTDRTKPFVLFERGEGTHNYVAQSGLLGAGLPNHNTLYSTDQDRYALADGVDEVKIKLKASGGGPLNAFKILTFHRGSYLVDVEHVIENAGTEAVSGNGYFQLVRDGNPPKGSSNLVPTFTGMAVYEEKEKFKKINFSDIDKGKQEYPKQADNGWIGMLQHYFVAAWIPQEKTGRENFTRKLDGNLYAAGVVLQDVTVAPGQTATVGSKLYVGPARNNLDEIAPGLGLAVDYGLLTVIATPLFWLMSLFNDWVHNWGVAIILLTVLIKLVFFPLSAASYRSMAKLRLVAPKLEKIKQQYGDDREKLNRAMMELYKTEKINPLGGCLPVLIQIPVFIALYWMILASVEMRYAPFFGWITDLSAADPYFILPVIMGVSMIVQMRLNPKPPDPIQAKVMQIMPIAFSVFFFFFPAGLVLYSIVNNLLSIAQQWYITRAAEGANKGGAASKH